MPHSALYFTEEWYTRVLNVDPGYLIACWPGWEPSGNVAHDISAHALNGSYTGVALGQPGIGDGYRSVYYNGAAAYTNILTAGLAAAFNGQELTVIAWPKVANAGVWTDGLAHAICIFQVDANNYVYLYKMTTDNQLIWYYMADGTSKTVSSTAFGGNLSFNCFGITATKTNNAMKSWANGIQIGSTQTGLGTWAGTLVRALIGSSTTTPATPWLGSIGPVAVWGRALTDTKMKYVMQGPR